MAAIVVELASVNALTRTPEGGLQLTFSDNNGVSFNSEDEFRQWIIDNATAVGEAAKTAAQAMLIGHLLAKDPLLNSLPDWNGKKVTIDVEQAVAANVFKVTG